MELEKINTLDTKINVRPYPKPSGANHPLLHEMRASGPTGAVCARAVPPMLDRHGMAPVRPPSRIACGPGRAVVCTEYGQAAHGIACRRATYNPTHVLCGASCDAKGGALAYAVIRASRAELDVAVRSAGGPPVARGRAVRLAQKGMPCHTLQHRSSFRR
jgi:hypothetical protein